MSLRRRQRRFGEIAQMTDAPRPATLFGDSEPDNNRVCEQELEENNRRASLLARALEGDLSTLSDAQAAGDLKLYTELLDALTVQSAGQEQLDALVSLVLSHDMSASANLAWRVSESWRAQPSRRSTIEMLHMSALAGDAAIYAEAVDAVIRCWRNDLLPWFSASDLAMLIESHYWLLTAQARSGGAGFQLKRRLGNLSEELADARKPVTNRS